MYDVYECIKVCQGSRVTVQNFRLVPGGTKFQGYTIFFNSHWRAASTLGRYLAMSLPSSYMAGNS
jgi:hypothetical protein